MLKTPIANKKGLAITVSFLLAVVQPVAECATARPAGDRPANAAALIAVAEVVGTVQRNGSPLANGSIVASGDSLTTKSGSALLLASSPDERLWLGPDTVATLSKSAANVSISLQHGTVKFQTLGHIAVTFPHHEGLAIRSRSGSPASAQMSFANDQNVNVNVESGYLELVQAGESQLLETGGGRLSALAPPPQAGSQLATSDSQTQPNAENTGSLHGTVVGKTLVAVPDASITLTNAQGNSYITVSGQLGHFAFRNVPPGNYALHVTHAGFPDYDMHNVVVTSGVDSSAYVQLQTAGGGSGGGNHGLIIALVVGGAVAGGIGAWAASKGKSSVSPTSPTQ